MKLRIYLEVEGQESLATNKTVWPWNYSIRTEDVDVEPSKGGKLLAEVEVELPSRESCIPTVLEMLKEREQSIQAEAHKDLRAVAERRENLLALTYAGE